MSWDRKESSESGGAAAKLAAERMRLAAQGDAYEAPEGPAPWAIPVTVIFALCAIFSMLLPEDALYKIVGQTGILSFDQLLAGSPELKMTASEDADRLIAIAVRAVILFVAAGLPPFVAAVMVRLLGRARLDPFVACWGMMVILPLAYLLWGNF